MIATASINGTSLPLTGEIRLPAVAGAVLILTADRTKPVFNAWCYGNGVKDEKPARLPAIKGKPGHFALPDLLAGKTYTIKVQDYNKVEQKPATPVVVIVVESAQVEPLPVDPVEQEPATPRIVWGVTGDVDDDPDRDAARMYADGVRVMRVWLGTGNIGPTLIARLKKWRAAGIKILVTVNPSERKDPNTGKLRDVVLGGPKWANAWIAMNGEAIAEIADYFGLGNEWNFTTVYTPSDANGAAWHGYYRDTLAVLSAGLRVAAPDVKICCIPIADDWSQKVYPTQYKLLAAAGVFDDITTPVGIRPLVDVVDVHPYCQPGQIDEMGRGLDEIRVITGGKPFVSSEFNLSAKAANARVEYPKHIRRYIETLAPRFDMLCAFRKDPTKRWPWPTFYDAAGEITEDMGRAFLDVMPTFTK